ncbi:uncharacterized protein V2V93DRAFT_270634 [Kockiozyma suomiensis]|uniref:uncharacterized protein n=1 Tax=Kockiozyma suomiensis TaxID=1337062 RepID=UPI0033437F28
MTESHQNTGSKSKARHFGRGGYGNITTEPEQDSSQAPVQVFTSPNQTFLSGRGGYGNVQPVETMPTQSPEEYLSEVDHAMSVKRGDVFKIGRGGAGNVYVEGANGEEYPADSRRGRTEEALAAGGEEGAGKEPEGFFARIGRRFSSGSRSRSRDKRSSSRNQQQQE